MVDVVGGGRSVDDVLLDPPEEPGAVEDVVDGEWVPPAVVVVDGPDVVVVVPFAPAPRAGAVVVGGELGPGISVAGVPWWPAYPVGVGAGRTTR
ncbi:MAG TPA: hypothetical protein VGR90_11110 [Acidimicrobiales bacterium]|nr:hypothetical protein [Acidimicrobiales bacterium]